MNISIKKNIQPKLDVPVMKCDKPLDAKLDMYDVTRFMNKHSTNIVIGKPGQGKSSLIYGLFKSKKLLFQCYSHIYVFQPQQSMNSVKDPIFSTLPPEQMYNELTYENLSFVLDMIKDSDEDESHCIILDDMGAYLKQKETLQMLKEMMMNKRHLHLSMFYLVQTFYSTPKEIRKLFNNAFIYKVNQEEMGVVFQELIEINKKCIPQLLKVVYDKPHTFLFCNIESQRMFKNFDEIIIGGNDIGGVNV
jgi:AAA15 family ATPase/GTPase